MRSEDFPQELLRLLLSAAVGPFHLLDAVPTGHSALGKACWVNSKPRSQATLIQLVCLEGLRSHAWDPFCWCRRTSTLRAAAKSWKAEKAPNPHGCGCLQRQQLPALQQGDAHPAKPSPSRCLSLRSELSHICAALGLLFQSKFTYIPAIPFVLVYVDPQLGLQLRRSTQQK